MESLIQLFQGFAALAGVAAFLAAVINIGKAFGWVKDGLAPTWSTVLNLVAFVAFVVLRLFAPEIDIAGVDGAAAQLANTLVAILAFVGQLGVAKGTNAILRGAPVIGFSHSD